MTELRLRRRNRLRRKEVETLAAELKDILGVDTFQPTDAVETGEAGGNELIVYKSKPVGIQIDGKPFFTVHGLLMFAPEKRYVTVDMGAVKFLANGADVMAPGVIEADPDIKVGDAVWVRDQNNKRPLLVGVALMDGPSMVAEKGGKAVKTVHYVGDKIWNLAV
jgi:PUA domain protein